MEPDHHKIRVGDVELGCLTLGSPERPALIMLHGLRDVGWSLLPVARALADERYVVIPDLRGHGRSDKPGIYTIEHFMFDVHELVRYLNLTRFDLFGHSLGGHLASRYAAVFPEQVRSAMLIEALGPPRRGHEGDEKMELHAYRQHLLSRLAITGRQRPLNTLTFAAERLRANNPRLLEDRALALAQQATTTDRDGNLVWAFDPRAQQVFVSITRTESERFWRHVRCPTLVVTGELAYEYWSQGVPAEAGWDGRYHGDDLPSRLRCFRDLTHHAFADAGHMVHYDAPHTLGTVCAHFLENES